LLLVDTDSDDDDDFEKPLPRNSGDSKKKNNSDRNIAKRARSCDSSMNKSGSLHMLDTTTGASDTELQTGVDADTEVGTDTDASTEKRIDRNNGVAYTKKQFAREYGGSTEWDSSRPASVVLPEGARRNRKQMEVANVDNFRKRGGTFAREEGDSGHAPPAPARSRGGEPPVPQQQSPSPFPTSSNKNKPASSSAEASKKRRLSKGKASPKSTGKGDADLQKRRLPADKENVRLQDSGPHLPESAPEPARNGCDAVNYNKTSNDNDNNNDVDVTIVEQAGPLGCSSQQSQSQECLHGDVWTCRACTYANDVTIYPDHCGSCEARRPSKRRGTGTAAC